MGIGDTRISDNSIIHDSVRGLKITIMLPSTRVSLCDFSSYLHAFGYSHKIVVVTLKITSGFEICPDC